MVEEGCHASALNKAFVFLVAFLTGAGWVLSACGKLCWIAVALPVGLAVAYWLARREYPTREHLLTNTLDSFKSPLVLGVCLVLGIAAVLYTPALLDSLTYRLPRILLWLERGSVYFIDAAEPRLNYLGQVWELCTAPFIQIFGIKAAWVWPFLSWLMCQRLFFTWACRLGQSGSRAHAFALIANTSNFAVLQASNTSNDLLAATLLLLASDFVWRFETSRNPALINWAALSTALCSGVKPHFAVMAVPFCLWFVAARSRPWQAYEWKWSPLILPALLLCSAIPTFCLNHVNYGRITGPAHEESFQRSGAAANIVFGSLQLGWQALQPSPNPAALLNDKLDTLVEKTGATKLCPRFSLQMSPLMLADAASTGLVGTVIILAGWIQSIRQRHLPVTRFAIWGLAVGVLGFFVAVSQYLPGSVGRSFLAFWLLGLPLAFVGWRNFSDRALRVIVLISVASGLITVVLNPTRPLWPARTVRSVLAERGLMPRVVKGLDSYLLFRERAVAGRGLADQVPNSEPFFVALIASDRPLLPVLTSRHGPGKVRLLRAGATATSLLDLGPRYVVLCDRNKENYPELINFLQTNASYRVAATAEHVTRLARGPGMWTLYAPQSSNTVARLPVQSTD